MSLRKSFQKSPEDFWAEVIKSEDGCWEWGGYREKKGYGRLKYQGRRWSAHRLSWTLTHGEIPEGMFICHRCDHPPCVRPDHLFPGTPADNTLDSEFKNRRAKGERSGNVTLIESDVVSIRRMYSDGISQDVIASTFGIAQCNVSNIVLGYTWSHAPGAISEPMSLSDRARKKPPGYKPASTRLSPEQVSAIRAEYSRGGVFQEALAEKYGVSQSLISAIVLRQCWKDVA